MKISDTQRENIERLRKTNPYCGHCGGKMREDDEFGYVKWFCPKYWGWFWTGPNRDHDYVALGTAVKDDKRYDRLTGQRL